MRKLSWVNTAIWVFIIFPWIVTITVITDYLLPGDTWYRGVIRFVIGFTIGWIGVTIANKASS